MAERNLPHLIVPTAPVPEPFTLVNSSRSGDKPAFGGDRAQHGLRLAREFEAAITPPSGEPERSGTYITFVSFPGLQMALKSLDPQAAGDQPELVAVRETETPDGAVEEATVYIPDGKKGYFLKRMEEYVETAGAAKTRHAVLVEGIQGIRRATIRELWTDADDLFPDDPTESRWWEVWLRKRDGQERERFEVFAKQRGLRTSGQYLGFGDRTVVLLNATAAQLAGTLDLIDDLAELRRPHDVSSFLTSLPAAEQREWVEDLRNRLRVAGDGSPVVCILDTGVQDGHPLLADSLAADDVHVADAQWRSHPVNPHGTEMAGLALFGDLEGAIASHQSVQLGHRLESVKILPDQGQTDPDLYGAVTARAVDRPEIQAANRARVFMLAVTAHRPTSNSGGVGGTVDPHEAGRPTSWSATIDALAFGRTIDAANPQFTYLERDEPRGPRLFVVSAANIRDLRATDDHLDRSDLEPVEDPAQSWNALTVGAYSQHDDMRGAPPGFAGYTPIAKAGELSPVSRTSVMFDRKWPVKPDVVADGGNVAVSQDGTLIDTPPNLGLLTTRLQKLGGGLFTMTRDTSAATAQVAAIAADIHAAYPRLRPETVRALVVHSAQWTSTMRTHFNKASNKADLANLLRRYGMGVPDGVRAIRSAADSLTLVAEGQIRPYESGESGTARRVREMNLHQLPWPIVQLEALSGATVKLRVTLSYFVEPNPSRRGWSGRYAYPSHGLRFATRRPDETVDAFRQRINTRARSEGNRPPHHDTEKGWLFGSKHQQAAGSLHTDIWTGTAADLASKGAIAVYPVVGWWKERPSFDQSDQGVHYSLVVGLESPEVDVDLWTPVAQQIASVVEVTAGR